MRISTRLMFKKHGWRIDRTIHNYIYFRFYYPYVKTVNVLLPVLKYLNWFKPIVPIGKMIFNRYHSKVISAEDTKKIFSLNEDIRNISVNNKKVIPYKYATKIIFQEPEYIAIMDCPCKMASNTCTPVQSCIAVGREIASFWLDHCKKYNARKITQAEALDIIKAFRKTGHITQAFFKVATGGSTGVICNCCPDCCVSLRATTFSQKVDSGLSMTSASGYSVLHDKEKCTECGQCEKVCNFGSIQFLKSTDSLTGKRVYHKNSCMGCELCVEECPEGALSIYTDISKPLPLDLDMVKNMSVVTK